MPFTGMGTGVLVGVGWGVGVFVGADVADAVAAGGVVVAVSLF